MKVMDNSAVTEKTKVTEGNEIKESKAELITKDTEVSKPKKKIAGANCASKEGGELARLPYLRSWFRNKSAIIFHLANGTLQINFFPDHCKLIVCPLMKAVTFIDAKRNFRTYSMANLAMGCNRDLFSRLRYAHIMVERLLKRTSLKKPRINERKRKMPLGLQRLVSPPPNPEPMQ